MTTCVWSYKHSELGADRLAGGGTTVNKVFKLKNGSYLTGAGFMDDLIEVAHWMNKGGKEEDKPELADRDTDKDSDFILVRPSGKAFWLTCPFLRPVEITDEFYAVGSGAHYAFGALEAGATPAEALAIAAKYDESTGAEFDIVTVKGRTNGKRVSR